VIQRVRFTLLALVVSLLAGCASRPPAELPTPAPAPERLPWTAAIGRLDIAGSPRICTAALVAPDLIVTAAHCLHQVAVAARAEDIVFRPNFGAAPDLGAYRGTAIPGIGGTVQKVKKASDIVRDWALVSIAPPITAVRPLLAHPMTTTEAMGRIAAGETLFTAGYHGLGNKLQAHSPCTITEDKNVNELYAQDMIVTTCIIRISDSGSPIILLDANGIPRILGIFVAFGEDQALGFSYGVGARVFAHRLPAPLLSVAPSPPFEGVN
jgi:protease YdgD